MTNKESLEGSVMGVPFRFKGVTAFLIVIILVLLGSIAWLVHFSLGNWGNPIDIGKTFDEHRAAVTKQHDAFRDTVDELTYVMTLTPEERAKLDLDMPESLRQKLQRRR